MLIVVISIAVGLVALLYELVLTFPDEVQLVWMQRSSLAKKLFLLNRYLVPTCHIIIAYCASPPPLFTVGS
jgi:hypothetical protein